MLQQRRLLAQVARREGLLSSRGDAQKGGEQIEKYLGLLRPALGTRPKTQHLIERGIGFEWCGAFVYYCCRQAGFTFSPRPDDSLPGTLAAVFIWRQWAELPQNRFLIAAAKHPEVGDLVIFNRLLSEVDQDHIGIVLEVYATHLVTAEGNVENAAGIFQRAIDERIDCYIRIN